MAKKRTSHSSLTCPAIPTPSLVHLPGHKNTLAAKKRTSHSSLVCPAIPTPSFVHLPGHKNTWADKKRTSHSGSPCPAMPTPSLVRLPGHKNTLAGKKRTNHSGSAVTPPRHRLQHVLLDIRTRGQKQNWSCVSCPATILKLSPACPLPNLTQEHPNGKKENQPCYCSPHKGTQKEN